MAAYVGVPVVDQTDWYNRENPPKEYTFTLFRDDGTGELDAMNIVADRWHVRGGVLHFHQGPWRNYSISTNRVAWIRRNQ